MSILLLEVRNDEHRQVSFSAIDFKQNQFLWKDVRVSEPWWVNLYVANESSIVLSKFENTSNPDSVSYIGLDLLTASVLEEANVKTPNVHVEGINIIAPVQYHQQTAHFETVKKFIEQKINSTPVHVIEYLENSGLIFISLYLQVGPELENQLLVVDEYGKVLLQDKLGVNLKGLGLETFFLQAGYLFYVRNKVELVTYRMLQPTCSKSK